MGIADKIQVGIVMGSDSDLPVMKKAANVLERFGVLYFMTVASAHRTPEKVLELAQRAEKEDWKVLDCRRRHGRSPGGILGRSHHSAGYRGPYGVLVSRRPGRASLDRTDARRGPSRFYGPWSPGR